MLLSNPSRVVARIAMDLIQTLDRARETGPEGLCAYYVQLVPAGKIALVISSKAGPTTVYGGSQHTLIDDWKQTAHALLTDYCRAHSVQTGLVVLHSGPEPCSRARRE